MGKTGPGEISDRIKAKGLQKLRWYCQMCRQQSRDEKGFKCYCLSEFHQRKMKEFGKDPPTVIDRYSNEFEKAFLDLVRSSYRLGQFSANVVYNVYINSRNHVQISWTKWATLTDFVKYLGRTSKCEVKETAQDWFIAYNNQDSDSERERKRIRIDSVEDKQELDMKRPIQEAAPEQKIVMEFPDQVSGRDKSSVSHGKSSGDLVVDGYTREQEKAKEQSNRKDCWLCEGITVKVINEAFAEKGYYKQKGVIRKVIGECVGVIEMLESKQMLRVKQVDLETVIPQIGAVVKIVNA